MAPNAVTLLSNATDLTSFLYCMTDVLFDSNDNGFLVDINPRVTGSCPALMTLQVFNQKYGFECGLFRRGGGV